MFEPGDAEYFRMREQDERRLAAQSPDPAVAAIHTTLADRYAVRLNGPSPALQNKSARARETAVQRRSI